MVVTSWVVTEGVLLNINLVTAYLSYGMLRDS